MTDTSTATDSLREQHRVLRRAAELLASAQDFDGTLRQTIGACLPALGDFGFFDVANGEEVRRTVGAHQAPDIEAQLAPTRWMRQERADGLNLCALSTGQAALHPDIDDGWYRAVAANEDHLRLLRELAFRSMITVPVRYRGELLGALTLFMGRSGRRHDAEDLAFAAELALLVGPVVANARLLEQRRRAEQALREQEDRSRQDTTERMKLLASAGAALANSLDPEDTLQAIATTIVPAIADWCRIDLLDESGVLQRRLAYHTDPRRAGEALALARRMRAAADTVGSMAWCIAHGRPHYGRFDVPPASEDPQLREYTQAFGMRSHLIIPLVARGRTIGAMGVVQAESGRDLSEADRALVQELGHRAALALDNARLYAEASAARRQAEAASRAKDEFLAMLGHELRNPLAPIATALELMARREPKAHIEERRIVARQVAHLSRLIDDLLDVSRITRGKVELKRAPLDLRTVVANALEQTQPVFEKRPRPVAVQLAPEPVPVEGDAVRLTQVVCNLLVNAAKFTPADGQVTLDLRAADGQAVLMVQDQGRGIAPDLLPRVFDAFVQGGQALDRQSGGLGLGLAIVRTLVELHGGKVMAQSEGDGRGSRFTVQLPLCSMQADGEPAAQGGGAALSAGSGRILIVDDNADAAETLGELLKVLGYDVRCAGDAEAALEVLQSYPAQVGLLDIGLPLVDGYELAGRIRQLPIGNSIRLVALTGYGSDEDRQRARAAGFDEHMVKPVNPEALITALNRLMP